MISTLRSNTTPIDISYAGQLANEGRRLMRMFQGADDTSADKNPAKGEVQIDTQGRFGIDHACAKFSGDCYDGTLEINNDERQTDLDRKYVFDNNAGTVTITQRRPTFGAPRFDVYHIDEIHSQATLEHVVG